MAAAGAKEPGAGGLIATLTAVGGGGMISSWPGAGTEEGVTEVEEGAGKGRMVSALPVPAGLVLTAEYRATRITWISARAQRSAHATEEARPTSAFRMWDSVAIPLMCKRRMVRFAFTSVNASRGV